MLKKLILFLFILCPIAGVVRSGFNSDKASNPLSFSEEEAKVVVYQSVPDGVLGTVMVELKILCKGSNTKKALVLTLNDHGRPEWMPIRDTRKPFTSGQILFETRGKAAEKLISKIVSQMSAYPFTGEYQGWFGPNQNTLVAFLAKRIPELQIHFPSNASGKDYLGSGLEYKFQPSDMGMQLSFGGYGGVGISKQEAKVQVLGFVLSYDWSLNRIGLPGFGDLDLDPYIEFFRQQFK